MLLSAMSCTHCGGAGLELEPNGVAVCKFCGTANKVNGIICPRCEWVSPASRESCPECGTGLFRTCAECQTKNWSGSEQCVKCGAALDLLAYTASRLQQADTTNRLSSQQRFAKEIKAEEERAAQKRTAQFAEMEARRQQGLAESQARQRAQERQLMLGLLVSILLIAAVVAVAVVYFKVGQP